MLADTLIGRFGEKRAPLALGIASLLFGFPIFFDAGLVVMLPIIFSVARRFGGSVLRTPCRWPARSPSCTPSSRRTPARLPRASCSAPTSACSCSSAWCSAIPTWYVGGYLFGTWAGRRFELPVPTSLGGPARRGRGGGPPTRTRTGPVASRWPSAPTQERPAAPAPSFGTVLTVLLLPLVLIFLNTGLNTLATAGAVDGDAPWVDVLRMIGQTPVALLITVIVAMVVLGRGRYDKSGIEEIVNGALGPVCAIILITGAGGMFGGVLRASGIGEALAEELDATGLPVIVAAFVVATALRVAQGSATVALTTTAGLIAPAVEATSGLSALDLCFIVIAIACGVDRALPRQRLRVLAGRPVPGDGREDDAQDVDGDGDPARHGRVRPRTRRQPAAVSAASPGPVHVVVMGVSGCGKTTVAEGVADLTGWRFAEGDAYHPRENIEKMASGTPLDDDDRRPWLERLASWIAEQEAAGRSSVLSCSALKRSYRDVLRSGAPDVRFVHVHGDRGVLEERLSLRAGHFFPARLLDTQLATLEQLQDDEVGVVVDVALTPQQQVAAAMAGLHLARRAGPGTSAAG